MKGTFRAASTSTLPLLWLLVTGTTVPAGPSQAGLTLARYLESRHAPNPPQDMIACAGGGYAGFLGAAPQPVSIFYYPAAGASSFKYFETPSAADDPDDYSRFEEVAIPSNPLFQGFLRRFATPYRERETWVRVSYRAADGQVHLSAAIRLKPASQPTRFTPQAVRVEKPGPTFRWNETRSPRSAIYFEVVSEAAGRVLSATYTRERHFRFYDTSNVLINLRDVHPAPRLKPGSLYHFTLMAVSPDNWVNWIARTPFRPPKK